MSRSLGCNGIDHADGIGDGIERWRMCLYLIFHGNCLKGFFQIDKGHLMVNICCQSIQWREKNLFVLVVLILYS